MNEQNPIPNQTPINQPVAPTLMRPRFSDLLRDIFKKFRENKKLFRLTVIILGIMFIIIVVGSLFSVFRNQRKPKTLASPTSQPTKIFENLEANKNAEQLKNLKEKILNLDIYQKRLTPPTIDFKVDF